MDFELVCQSSAICCCGYRVPWHDENQCKQVIYSSLLSAANFNQRKETEMHARTILNCTIVTLLLVVSGSLYAADKDQDRDRVRDQDKDTQQLQDRDQTRLKDKDMIYGYDLMTVQERTQYRNKMRSLNTEQERTAFREEHHQQMMVRAKERGVTIPETPPHDNMMNRNLGGGTGAGAGGGRGR
jgi:hypothetical protein